MAELTSKPENTDKIAKQKETMDFLDELFTRCERHPNELIKIDQIMKNNINDKRKLYNILNVLSACNVCTRADPQSYVWNSFNRATDSIYRISREFEQNATQQPIEELFNLPESPQIDLITTRFIGFFVFFGLPVVNIGDISFLLCGNENVKRKAVLRRLNHVANLLEKIGIIRRSGPNSGEFQINVDLAKVCLCSFQALANEQRFFPDSIEFQLNRLDENILKQIFRTRREILSDILRSCSDDQQIENINSSIDSQPQKISA